MNLANVKSLSQHINKPNSKLSELYMQNLKFINDRLINILQTKGKTEIKQVVSQAHLLIYDLMKGKETEFDKYMQFFKDYEEDVKSLFTAYLQQFPWELGAKLSLDLNLYTEEFCSKFSGLLSNYHDQTIQILVGNNKDDGSSVVNRDPFLSADAKTMLNLLNKNFSEFVLILFGCYVYDIVAEMEKNALILKEKAQELIDKLVDLKALMNDLQQVIDDDEFKNIVNMIKLLQSHEPGGDSKDHWKINYFQSNDKFKDCPPNSKDSSGKNEYYETYHADLVVYEGKIYAYDPDKKEYIELKDIYVPPGIKDQQELEKFYNHFFGENPYQAALASLFNLPDDTMAVLFKPEYLNRYARSNDILQGYFSRYKYDKFNLQNFFNYIINQINQAYVGLGYKFLNYSDLSSTDDDSFKKTFKARATDFEDARNDITNFNAQEQVKIDNFNNAIKVFTDQMRENVRFYGFSLFNNR